MTFYKQLFAGLLLAMPLSVYSSDEHAPAESVAYEPEAEAPTAEADSATTRVYTEQESVPETLVEESEAKEAALEKKEPLPEIIPLEALADQSHVDAFFKKQVGLYLKEARMLETSVTRQASKRVSDITFSNVQIRWDALETQGWPEKLDDRTRLSINACHQAWELYYWVHLARKTYATVPLDANPYYYAQAESLLQFVARWDKDLAVQLQEQDTFMQDEAIFRKIARRLDTEIIEALTGQIPHA